MPMAGHSGRGSQMPKGEDVGVCSAETLHVHQAQQQGYMTAVKTISLHVSLMRKDNERLCSNAEDVDA